jgi:hypothetical protein
MAEFGQETPFDLKSPQDLVILFVAGKKFKRVARSEPFILNLVHLTHPAFTDKADDFIFTDRFNYGFSLTHNRCLPLSKFF